MSMSVLFRACRVLVRISISSEREARVREGAADGCNFRNRRKSQDFRIRRLTWETAFLLVVMQPFRTYNAGVAG